MVKIASGTTVKDRDGKILASAGDKVTLDPKLEEALIKGHSAEEWTPEKEAAEEAERKRAAVAGGEKDEGTKKKGK